MGAEPPQENSRRQYTSGAGFAVEWSGRQRETVLFPVPRFRRSHSTAKIQTVKGERVEISRAGRRKYDPYLDRLDRRSGTVRRTVSSVWLSILLLLDDC